MHSDMKRLLTLLLVFGVSTLLGGAIGGAVVGLLLIFYVIRSPTLEEG